jgi:hypothetical protein
MLDLNFCALIISVVDLKAYTNPFTFIATIFTSFMKKGQSKDWPLFVNLARFNAPELLETFGEIVHMTVTNLFRGVRHLDSCAQ